jgi:hypothetical protein
MPAPYLPMPAPYLPMSAPYLLMPAPYLPMSAPYLPMSAPYLPMPAPYLPMLAPYLPMPAPYLHIPAPYLHVPVDEPVELKIIIVLSERVDERLRHLQPPEEEGELNHKGVNALCLLQCIFCSRFDSIHRQISTLLNNRESCTKTFLDM